MVCHLTELLGSIYIDTDMVVIIIIIINFIQRKGTQKTWSLYKVVPNKKASLHKKTRTKQINDKDLQQTLESTYA